MWADHYPVHQDFADSIGDTGQISMKTCQIIAVFIADGNANEDLCIVLTYDTIRLDTHGSRDPGREFWPYLNQIGFIEAE